MKLRIVSVNLWHGGILIDEIISFLKDVDADIVLAQEVYNGTDYSLEPRYRSVETIEKALGYADLDFAPAFVDNSDVGAVVQGNAIFSKFPILERDVFFYENLEFRDDYVILPEERERAPRNLQKVKIGVAPGKEINAFNTHGIWGEHGLDTEDRIRMGEQIAENVEDISNLILMGDFNVRPNTITVGLIEDHLRNVFRGKIKTSFNKIRKNDPELSDAVVDMCFVSDDLNVVNAVCPDVDVSDHLPLIVDIEI